MLSFSDLHQWHGSALPTFLTTSHCSHRFDGHIWPVQNHKKIRLSVMMTAVLNAKLPVIFQRIVHWQVVKSWSCHSQFKQVVMYCTGPVICNYLLFHHACSGLLSFHILLPKLLVSPLLICLNSSHSPPVPNTENMHSCDRPWPPALLPFSWKYRTIR